MLRVTDIAMPLAYTEQDLRRRVAAVLGVRIGELLTCTLAKRSVDARKKDNIHFEITVDVMVENEPAVLNNKNCRRSHHDQCKNRAAQHRHVPALMQFPLQLRFQLVDLWNCFSFIFS